MTREERIPQPQLEIFNTPKKSPSNQQRHRNSPFWQMLSIALTNWIFIEHDTQQLQINILFRCMIQSPRSIVCGPWNKSQVFKKTGIIQSMFSDQNQLKLEINNQIFKKPQNIWKLNNIFLKVKLENSLNWMIMVIHVQIFGMG